MYIEPSTNIILLKNVPLNKRYEHTITFDSKEQQASVFRSKYQKWSLNAQTYQRVNKGVARVRYKPEDLYDCNYMMFQNEAFGSKWFYAFITRVEYVNNITSEIYFEIDVMQTWLLDYTMMESFVEREHSKDDVIGENLVPENLEMGEYMISDMSVTGKLINYQIIVASTFDKEGNGVVGGLYGGIYSGLKYNVFESVTELNEWLEGNVVAQKQDGIVSIFMMPSGFIAKANETPKNYEIVKEKYYGEWTPSGSGWTPNNNKLYTYPYNFMYVSNLEGASAIFPYEFFSDGNCRFNLIGDTSCNPGIILYPLNYKGVPFNYDEKLLLTGFPQCSYVTDTFRAFLAQSLLPNLPNTLTSVAKDVGRIAMGNVISGSFSIATTLASTLSQTIQHAIMPDQAHAVTNGYTQFASGMKEFMFVRKHISEYYAKLIDKYFDCYGYRTNVIKVPNIKSRPYYNYIKTLGCNIVGKMPSDDIAKICEIYDKGITFWHYKPNDMELNHVGNYSVPNKLK